MEVNLRRSLRILRFALILLVIAGALPQPCSAAGDASPSAAGDPSPYRQAAPTADGIGKYYEGREIARVMGFDGASWLDRPTREAEERPDLLVAELHLRSGMTVADIGAGSGYLSRRMAPRIAPGRLYAVDVQPEMVTLLRALSQETATSNVTPILGNETRVNLPGDSVDLAIMVDVYHELSFPVEVIHSVVDALKPGGSLVFVEYRGEDPAVPIKALHKMTERQLKKEMKKFPLQWLRTSETLPLQHMVFFKKRG